MSALHKTTIFLPSKKATQRNDLERINPQLCCFMLPSAASRHEKDRTWKNRDMGRVTSLTCPPCALVFSAGG